MSVELLAISAFVVAILTGVSQCIKKSNLKECKMCCIDSNCRDENKTLDIKMQEINEKIDKNEKKIIKNKNKLDIIKNKKRLSNIPETPDSIISTNADYFIETTEI